MITTNTIVPSQLYEKIEKVQQKVSDLEAKVTKLSQEKFELLAQNQALATELEIQKGLLAQYQKQTATKTSLAAHTDAQSRGTGMSASAGRDSVISFGA